MIEEIAVGVVQYLSDDPVSAILFLGLAAVTRMYYAERAEVRRLQLMLEDRIVKLLEVIQEVVRDAQHRNTRDTER